MLYKNQYLENWLAVNSAVGIGPAKFKQLLIEDPQLSRLPKGLKIDWSSVKRDLDWLAGTTDAHIISLMDPLYPTLLQQIPNPPPLLYILGNPEYLSHQQIAVVGSRKASTYGLDLAYKFAQEFAAHGICVTSGLAIGIDAAAHRGAMSSGITNAVCGNGLDSMYPALNKMLASQIIHNGCLISEFSIGTLPAGYNFPRRNRIISGLCLGVLVIEAAEKSGSLITADFAADQGRDVFALPASIHSPNSKGVNRLIKDGAKLVESADEVMDEFANLLNRDIHVKSFNQGAAKINNTNLSDIQSALLNCIDYYATSFDKVVMDSGLHAGVVGSTLAELEIFGLITAVPGGYARRLG